MSAPVHRPKVHLADRGGLTACGRPYRDDAPTRRAWPAKKVLATTSPREVTCQVCRVFVAVPGREKA